MNLKYVKRCLKEIKETSEVEKDNEKAHLLEDILYREFVSYVADNYHGDLSDIAKEVMSTRDIGFTRYYI